MIYTDENGKKYEGVTGGSVKFIKELELEKKKTIYDLVEGDEYWSIYGDEVYKNNHIEQNPVFHFDLFLTEQEVEKELSKRKALATIKKYIHTEGMTFEPDWNDEKQSKYHLGSYSHTYDFFSYGGSYFDQSIPLIGHFKTVEDVAKMIKDCDKELRILFNVPDNE